MKVQLGTCSTPETLGIFGLSWPEKVASEMIDNLKGTGYEGNLKSFWSAGGKNTTLVKNLQKVYTQYMIEGNQPPTFTGGNADTYAVYLSEQLSNDTATPQPVTLEFLRALYTLTQKGKIDYKLYNPVGYKETAEVITESKPKTGINLVLEQTGETLNKVLIVGGLAVGAYLLANVNKFIKR